MTVITINTLEFYRIIHLCCPHISIQAFVKTQCDLHCCPFKPYLSCQFSISFDLYLSIQIYVDKKVQQVLKCDSPDWHLQHICLPCTYILEDEPKLQFSMLYTVDGNDSLKCFIQWETTEIDDPNSNVPSGNVSILRDSSETTDTRRVGKGLYLSNEQVDQWSNEMLKATFPTYVDDDTNQNPCAKHWRNMWMEHTAKMWGIFEETGLFLALCWHGFVLLLVDIICSGELYVF